jgi:transketolase
MPNLIGGSADLSGSNNTKANNSVVINSKNFSGNYIHYGVREHGMAATMNGLALYHNLIPYGGTFLIFSDYCKPAIRLSALMGLRVIYIFSHDSIGLGEDGPTHQPIEQLTGLRAIPNLNVFRPADINETLECWEAALNNEKGPSAIILSRQKLNYNSKLPDQKNKSIMGAYDLNISSHDNNVTIIASGSEVDLALLTQKQLSSVGIESKVVSMPCQELFDKQDEDYKNKIIDQKNLIVSIEAGSIICWKKYLKNDDLALGIDEFGKSAPYKEIYDSMGLTSDKIVSLIQKKLRS